MSDQLNTVDDIVSMLDDMMSNGHGHVDVTVDNTQTELTRNVETANSLACKSGMACSVPTLMEGMDEELREDK